MCIDMDIAETCKADEQIEEVKCHGIYFKSYSLRLHKMVERMWYFGAQVVEMQHILIIVLGIKRIGKHSAKSIVHEFH
jgi:hypothetical protein